MNYQDSINFIHEQFNTNEFIPLHAPYFGGNEKKYLNECIDTTFVSSVGAFVDQFENEIINYTDTKKAVAVVNGTAGLQVALQLVGVKENDEVLTQALTFIATANAIKYNQAHPVFIDVDVDTMGLSPSAIIDFLEEFGDLREDGTYNKKTNRRIAACVPMHTFGFATRIDEIVEICKRWNIPVVEDAAESLGSKYKGKYLGGFGDVAVLSFNGNKIITSGGGGAIVTNNIELGTKAKYLTTTAKVPHAYEFFHDELGYNFRMPNINAALICAQLEQLPTFLANKRELAQQYKDFFENSSLKFRWELPESQANFWLMCVEAENKKERDLFLETTNQYGVMTRPIWQLMFKLSMYKDCQRDAQVNAQFLEDRIVNIPSSFRNKQ
ncbi:MAG: LegC family aminotransferase [Flavobacteriales bacterium]|nr:LegC family aminotransferase [Flavobacteriales bacterium]NCA20712.1 LegC family aminotransferase [Crocinitomicaceae bacterium]